MTWICGGNLLRLRALPAREKLAFVTSTLKRDVIISLIAIKSSCSDGHPDNGQFGLLGSLCGSQNWCSGECSP